MDRSGGNASAQLPQRARPGENREMQSLQTCFEGQLWQTAHWLDRRDSRCG
jgi:hypothetical protein